MNMSGINQKEYLKKYLGIGKEPGEKKRKKKSKKLGTGLKIVDDDVDVRLDEEIQVDLNADNDEAPQIVSVIDDRPPSLRIDEETHSKLWKPIGVPDTFQQTEKSLIFKGNMKLGKSGNKQNLLKSKRDLLPNKESKKISGRSRNLAPVGDTSPSKRKEIPADSDSDNSPPRNDNSPLRRNRNDCSPPRRKNYDSSPVRKNRGGGSDNSPPRRRNNDDSSPLKRERGGSSDRSPPRRPRMKKDMSSPPKRRKGEDYLPSQRIRSKDKSPNRTEGDSSPPRQNKAKIHGDLSPPRQSKGAEADSSPLKEIKTDKSGDNSPPRKRKSSPVRKRSRWGDSEELSEKLEKTLDGKTAGLQKAAELVKETQELKRREDELFRKLSSEVSGANAPTVVRRKNTEVDPEEEERKRKIEEETKAQYNRWGKGLKQVEDVNEKIKNELYEMSKPLARYVDDEDLERHLKNQEREGDPMLAYIRQKKRKKTVDGGAPVIQQYEGDAPPNRFGIRPGYRWDGVDRSSGYEKKWFEVQNSRQASIEENYKWSTEDM